MGILDVLQVSAVTALVLAFPIYAQQPAVDVEVLRQALRYDRPQSRTFVGIFG